MPFLQSPNVVFSKQAYTEKAEGLKLGMIKKF